MAKQDSLIRYSGKFGDTIGVKKNGKHHLRSRSRKKMKQTRDTKNAARRFGRASKTAAFIRKAFYSIAEIKTDNGHINRLTKLLIPSAGQDIKAIIGYRFNKSKSIKPSGNNQTISIRLNFDTMEVIDTQSDNTGTLITALKSATATEIIDVK